eukprot:CAMPEP_0177639200 /NCGR_PEP_ID=MMETSP0447-20121125/5895_1 /TAXON_ID=0 /ORGANISM="Stygamoeba regulata, Strain BSH-02190019" /LENGTH=333 /DNA_ID=CAMNT_0019141213 /DNA_START=45 /DNA_END=1043 /DNA_ORIENTATION=+
MASSWLDLVGRTPLVELTSLSAATGCRILGKCEFMSVGGSIKDRAAKFIIEAMESSGALQKGGLLVEATAGNTGIALLLASKQKGYRCLFTCPDKVSDEKIQYLRALGADVVLCPTTVPGTDPNHFINSAIRIAEEKGGVFTNQFDNLANMRAHYHTTGPEIWEATGGDLHALVTAAGTGGTVAGCSTFLKEKNSKVQVFLINPPGAGVVAEPYSEEEAGKHPSRCFLRVKTEAEKEADKSLPSSILEGIGSGRLYGNLSRAQVDHMFQGTNEAAVSMCNYVLKHEGFFIGGSAGLNVVGAVLAARRLGPGHTIVTFLCDSGNNYVSKLFRPE